MATDTRANEAVLIAVLARADGRPVEPAEWRQAAQMLIALLHDDRTKTGGEDDFQYNNAATGESIVYKFRWRIQEPG